MKLFTMHCDDGADDIQTLLFTTLEALETRQREIIMATMPPKGSEAFDAHADIGKIYHLLIAGEVEVAWDTWIYSDSLRNESMNYCVFEHEVELPPAKVIIDVRGGVAYLQNEVPCVEVEIIDHDNH